MANILSKLKESFFRGDIITKMLFINIALYLIVRLTDIFFSLTGTHFSMDTFTLHWLGLPAELPEIGARFWTIITGFFVHVQFLHLLFNMLWLFWFGRLFLSQFRSRELGGLYFIGGILGGIIYILAYNLFPTLKDNATGAVLIGASGAILAIVVATATSMPEMQIHTLLGSIRLKYIAVIAIVLSVLELDGSNAGGNFAHLGGALAGYLFVVLRRKNRDLLLPINWIIDLTIQIARPKPKMKVKYKRPTHVEYDFNEKTALNNKEIDAILDKIKLSGYSSLTKDEKQKLFDKGR